MIRWAVVSGSQDRVLEMGDICAKLTSRDDINWWMWEINIKGMTTTGHEKHMEDAQRAVESMLGTLFRDLIKVFVP